MIHGGDIYRNHVKLDFSVNINPQGIPQSVKEALQEAVDLSERYPDIHAQRLTERIRDVENAGTAGILCGNGASELFMAVVHAVQPKKILIPVPSFYGYEWAAQASGAEIIFYEMKEAHGFCLDEGIYDVLTEDMDLLFLANPNNPVGNILSEAFLMKICEHCLRKGIRVVLDECFLEFTGENGFGADKDHWEKYPNVVVVKAFTKLYAIPGVRLGYLMTGDHKLYEQIKKQLPEWNLSVFAQMAGCAALDEKEYRDRTVAIVQKEREYLMQELSELGITVYPGRADYLLLQTDLPLATRLLERQILIRDCSNYRGLDAGFYRIAVKEHKENTILIQELQDIEQKEGTNHGKH